MQTRWDEYAQVHVACAVAHTAMLASRSTLITIQSRLYAAGQKAEVKGGPSHEGAAG